MSAAEQHIRFAVRDTGIGIAEEMQQEVFQRFHRVQGAQGEGVGIGLYITCRLLQMLGGRIELESTLGKGSVFTVWIPCTPPAPKNDERDTP